MSSKNVTSVPQAIHDLVAPDKIASDTLCEARPFGIYNGKTLNLVYALNTDTLGAVTTSTSRSLSVAVDDTGRVIQTFAPQSGVATRSVHRSFDPAPAQIRSNEA